MTLDQVVLTVCTAIQPFTDRDEPNPMEVRVLTEQLMALFREQPKLEQAFVAAVQAIVKEARTGYVQSS